MTLPARTVPLVSPDDRTGQVSKPWYGWLLELVASLGFTQVGVGAVLRTPQDKMRDIVSVKDYGAVGDGVTDDTAAIIAAFAAIKTAGGGKLIVPTGRYKITSAITLDAMPMYRVVGDGGKINTPSGQTEVAKSSVFVNAISGGGTMFTQNGTVSAGVIVTGPNTWEHVAFDGTSDNTNNIGFDSRNGYDMTRFEHCSWLGGKWGWTCSNSAGVFNVRWDDCSFFNMKIGCYLPTNGGSPDYLQMVWNDCLFRYCTQYGVDAAVGNSYYFTNTMVEGCTSGGIRLDGVYTIKFDGCHFELNGTGYDIEVKDTTLQTKTLSLIGNTFTFNTGQAVQVRVADAGKMLFLSNTSNGSGGSATASIQVATPGGREVVFLENNLATAYSVSGATELSPVQYVSTTYTPAWTSSGTQPVLNDGTIVGRYQRVGNTVTVNVVLTMGASTTFGTGTYRISLPITPAATYYSAGVAQMLDSGTNNYVTMAYNQPGTAYCFFFTSSSPAAIVTNTVPFTWAVNDKIEMSITYAV